MVGLAELRRSLPENWKGFANFVMRQPGRRGQDREIDVVIVTPDRVIVVDLKHVRGRIENRGGFWYRGDSRLYPSPAHKIRENAKVLASLMRDELRQLRYVPPVESVVVLTAPTSDPTGLTQVERERSLRLGDFIRISDPSYMRTVFTTASRFGGHNDLCGGANLAMLQRFFRNNRMFEPRRAKYQGFVPTGHSEFKHRLFSEFSCHEESNPSYTGLLRLWDFSVEDEFLVEESRRPVAERERTVLGYIRTQRPEFYDNYVLRSIAHDAEFTLRYSEVFDRQPDLERLTRFAASVADIPISRRMEIARLFLDRVAALHRMRVAHRDLDRHSVWVDDARSKVVLSGFGAAHFPARSSIGPARSKLLAGGARVPEDEGLAKPSTPFQHDVFMAGAVVWNLIAGNRLPLEGNVPKWAPNAIDATDVPPQYADWFARCLAADPRGRFIDGVEAADAFGELMRRGEKVSLERQLERYRYDVDPMSDYTPTEWKRKKPHRVYRSAAGDTALFVKSWPERSLGEPRKCAARLIEFFGRVEALKGSAEWTPKINLACLCTDGLLLVQEWIDGTSLSETDTSGWSGGQRREFIAGLIRAVEGLHSLGLAHGDLSPANVMLRKGGSAFKPVLVDVVDFSLEEGGKSTPAYCPDSNHDVRMRDRFAVCTIAKEIVEGVTGQDEALIALGADRCGEGDTPWLTLKPLSDALIPAREATEPLKMRIELRRVIADGPMLGDNGVFHIVRSKGRDDVIEIVGFDQKLTIEYDPGDLRPKFGRVDRVSPTTLDWARGYAVFSLNASIDLYRSSVTSRFTGVDKLIHMVREANPFSAPHSAGPSAISAETTLVETKQFPVARFWKETIAVEEAARPEIRLVSDPRWDEAERTLSFECDKGIEDVMPLEGQSVVLTWNGSRLGDVDAGRCRGAAVAVRNARNWKGLGRGDVLRLQSNDDLVSFNRRSRAVGRILEGRAEVEHLIMYFDPQTDLLPRRIAAEVDDADLDAYELNDDQKRAFKHLWTQGPLGLLQGPPGTGKTRFIGAFAHYALTKGGLRNVLLLSQSNEAVNTAAERVLNISPKLTGSIDMLRVGYSEKTSPKLLPYHSRAIQDRYRELFRASLKERVAYPSKRLGLGHEYVAEALENEALLGSLARQVELAEGDLATHPDGDVKAAARDRLQGLNRTWLDLLEENSISPGIGTRDTLESTRDDIAARHGGGGCGRATPSARSGGSRP
jgi:serine/threonine protein kinase